MEDGDTVLSSAEFSRGRPNAEVSGWCPRQGSAWALIGHSLGVLGKLLPFSESQFPRLHHEDSYSTVEMSGDLGEPAKRTEAAASALGAVGLLLCPSHRLGTRWEKCVVEATFGQRGVRLGVRVESLSPTSTQVIADSSSTGRWTNGHAPCSGERRQQAWGSSSGGDSAHLARDKSINRSGHFLAKLGSYMRTAQLAN